MTKTKQTAGRVTYGRMAVNRFSGVAWVVGFFFAVYLIAPLALAQGVVGIPDTSSSSTFPLLRQQHSLALKAFHTLPTKHATIWGHALPHGIWAAQLSYGPRGTLLSATWRVQGGAFGSDLVEFRLEYSCSPWHGWKTLSAESVTNRGHVILYSPRDLGHICGGRFPQVVRLEMTSHSCCALQGCCGLISIISWYTRSDGMW